MNESTVMEGPLGYSDELESFIGSMPESMAVSRAVGTLLIHRLRELELLHDIAVTPRIYMMQVEELLFDCKQGASDVEGEIIGSQAQYAGRNADMYRYEAWRWARLSFGESFGSEIKNIVMLARVGSENEN